MARKGKLFHLKRLLSISDSNVFKSLVVFSSLSPVSSTAEHSAVEQSPADSVFARNDSGSAVLSPKGCWFKSGTGDTLRGSSAPVVFFL